MNPKTGLLAAFGSVWMMRPDAFDSMCALLSQVTAANTTPVNSSDHVRGLRWMAGGRVRKASSVAVMGLYGMIDKRSSWMMDMMGGTSTDAFGAMFDQLVADPAVKGIVIDTDSPGGNAVGTPELSQKIFNARTSKPIVAISNSEMNSAGYYIASAASKVFVTPSSGTGSIGVWSAAAEYSKQLEADGVKVHVWRSQGSPDKAPFLPYQEFTADAINQEQQAVDRIYGEFTSDVARNRGISVTKVRSDFGKGRVMSSAEAVSSGLADKVATLEQVVSRMESGRLNLNSLNESMAAAWDDLPEPDESWKSLNETERMRSDLRRRGVLS